MAEATKEAKGENFRFRLPADLKRAWVEMCEARKISQQDAIEALIWFCTQQEPLAQAMLLKQQPATDDLIAVVLKRLRGKVPLFAELVHMRKQPPTGRQGEQREEGDASRKSHAPKRE